MPEPGNRIGRPVPPPTKTGDDISNREAAEITPIETREGLPVITEQEYYRLYNTDIRAAGQDTAATFNFQGYVKTGEGTFYRDALATNGIEGGIHVGTDGIIDYSALMDNHRMSGPEQVGEYDIYITIPGDVQKRLGVYCQDDSCYSVEEKLADIKEWEDEEEVKEEIAHAQSSEGWIVMRLGLDPKGDELARKKAAFLHEAIVRHLEEGGSPSRIEKVVYRLENKLKGIRLEDLRSEKLLQG